MHYITFLGRIQVESEISRVAGFVSRHVHLQHMHQICMIQQEFMN